MNSTVSRSAADIERLEARFGLRVGAMLHEQADHAPHDISERLRVARERALERARHARVAPAVASAPAEVVVGQGRTTTLGRQPGWLFRFASVVPLIVLVAGLIAIDEWHDRAQIEEVGRQNGPGPHHANAARLFDDELHVAIERILDEGERSGEAGRVHLCTDPVLRPQRAQPRQGDNRAYACR